MATTPAAVRANSARLAILRSKAAACAAGQCPDGGHGRPPAHLHRFGPFELARFTGNPVRRCQEPTGPGEPPCRFVSMDGDDDDGQEA